MSSNGDDLVVVGRVGRPHGLDGAFFVDDASQDPTRFAPGTVLRIGGRDARVVERKRAGGRIVIRLDGPAERGAALGFPRAELPPPSDPDAYYVFQLVGLDVVEEGGRRLGTVAHVAPGPANDVLELDSGVALPLVDACVLNVDLAAGTILTAPGFADPE